MKAGDLCTYHSFIPLMAKLINPCRDQALKCISRVQTQLALVSRELFFWISEVKIICITCQRSPPWRYCRLMSLPWLWNYLRPPPLPNEGLFWRRYHGDGWCTTTSQVAARHQSGGRCSRVTWVEKNRVFSSVSAVHGRSGGSSLTTPRTTCCQIWFSAGKYFLPETLPSV